MANEQTNPDAEALIARWGETVAREGWERIAATSSNPEYYDPWDAMEDTHPAKAHHRGMAHAAIRALMPAIEGEWFPIETAKKDRTVIWAVLRDDIYPVLRPEREDLKRWNGLQLPMRHPGLEKDDLDFGWGVAAPVGHGGFPDEWIAGWRPLPSPPRGTALPDTKGGE